VSKKGARTCTKYIAYIKNNTRDFLSAMKFKINYTIIDDEPMLPILNQNSERFFEAKFQKNCKNEDRCESELILSKELDLEETGKDTYSLDLGMKEQLIVKLTVNNLGDPAYEANLYFRYPSSLNFVNGNKTNDGVKCNYYNDTLVICNLGNPFPKTTTNIWLNFNVITKDMQDHLKFFTFVNSTSYEKSKQTSAKFQILVKKKAEVDIRGKTTAYVVFGGVVKGESAMKSFDEIGTRVYHKFEVFNEGPFTVKELAVNIFFPYQLESKGSQGKWLLYLEDIPMINTEYGQKICDVSGIVNELNLTHGAHGRGRMVPENFTMGAPLHPRVRRSEEFDRIFKREVVEEKAEALQFVSESGRSVVELQCNTTAKCLKINCVIPMLPKGKAVDIVLTSRVWNSTLVEEFPSNEVVIRTYARVDIPDKTIENDLENDEILLEIRALPEVPPASSISIWIYIIAIIVGILFFLLIVFVLYKLGFFKRNRPMENTATKVEPEQTSLIEKK